MVTHDLVNLIKKRINGCAKPNHWHNIRIIRAF